MRYLSIFGKFIKNHKVLRKSPSIYGSYKFNTNAEIKNDSQSLQSIRGLFCSSNFCHTK